MCERDVDTSRQELYFKITNSFLVQDGRICYKRAREQILYVFIFSRQNRCNRKEPSFMPLMSFNGPLTTIYSKD